MVEMPCSKAGDMGLITGQGTNIPRVPHGVAKKVKIKTKQSLEDAKER